MLAIQALREMIRVYELLMRISSIRSTPAASTTEHHQSSHSQRNGYFTPIFIHTQETQRDTRTGRGKEGKATQYRHPFCGLVHTPQNVRRGSEERKEIKRGDAPQPPRDLGLLSVR